MIVESKLRGHKIYFYKGEWYYSDTNEKTAETHKERPCGKCGLIATEEGHDACIANLSNVKNACCGHGNDADAYIQYFDGSDVRGIEAIKIQKTLKK